jgi:outer membrane protein OmpA-like peptidoglycan-associated protein
LNKKKIEGFTKQKNGLFISYTMVSLLDGSDKIIDSVLSDMDGAFMFRVETDKNYTLVGKNSSYLDGTAFATTLGLDTIIKADIILLKKPVAEQIKEKAADLAKILELNEIYFDMNKSNIRGDAKLELDKIVAIMNEYPNMRVELKSYTDCRASMGYNQRLSDQRAMSTAKYIKSRIKKPSRIYGKGYGETKFSSACPCENNAITNCTDIEYQAERNTQFIIIK